MRPGEGCSNVAYHRKGGVTVAVIVITLSSPEDTLIILAQHREAASSACPSDKDKSIGRLGVRANRQPRAANAKQRPWRALLINFHHPDDGYERNPMPAQSFPWTQHQEVAASESRLQGKQKPKVVGQHPQGKNYQTR
jgi:hypothetical protein